MKMFSYLFSMILGIFTFKRNIVLQNIFDFLWWPYDNVNASTSHEWWFMQHFPTFCLSHKWMSAFRSTAGSSATVTTKKRVGILFLFLFCPTQNDFDLQERTILRLPSCTLSVGKTGNRWKWEKDQIWSEFIMCTEYIYPWTIGGELDKWPVEAKGEPVLHKPGKVQEVWWNTIQGQLWKLRF